MKVKPSERGVALLTTLLLVAVMAAIAVSVIDDIRFAVRRSSNMRTLGQAQWYALGAETLAKSRLQAVLDRRTGYVTLKGGWSGLPVSYPIEHGAIRIQLTDRGACFNLNSVVLGEEGAYQVNPTGLAQLRALFIAVDLPDSDASRLADTLVDWIDSDATPEPFGGEDEAYLRAPQPRRTPGTLLAEESELLAIQGFTREIFERIRPHVCALPVPQLTDVNINTLRASDAPVLSAIYLGRLPVDAARGLIGERPTDGWSNQQAFLQSVQLRDVDGPPPIQQLVVNSRFFSLDGQVEFAGALLPYSALLEAHPSGELRTVARRWTRSE